MSLFHALAHNRRRAAAARKMAGAFAVYAKTKAGDLYKNPTATFATAEEAAQKAAYLQQLNPGREYVVVDRTPKTNTTTEET